MEGYQVLEDSSPLCLDDWFELGPFLVAFSSWFLESAKDFFVLELCWSSFLFKTLQGLLLLVEILGLLDPLQPCLLLVWQQL